MSAFDDQTSTFIIPSGAGFEVIFCPGGRSTTILTTNKDEMQQLAQQGRVDKQAPMSLKRSQGGVVRRNAGLETYQLDPALLVASVITTAIVSTALVW